MINTVHQRIDTMYNTSINAISGIPDYQIIMDVIRKFAEGKSKDDVFDLMCNQNIYGIRTAKSRERFFYGIKSVFLKFRSEAHQTLVYRLFQSPELLPLKKMALFFQFAVNNELFYDLSRNVLVKLWQSGRLTVDKAEFSAYLYELKEHHAEMQKWSTSTLETLASKYLTFLKKIDWLKGKVKKEFTRITPDDATLIYIIYLIKALDEPETNLLKHAYTPLLMIGEDALIERVKALSLERFWTVTTLGYDLKVDVSYTYEEIVDVIAQRDLSQI